MEQQYLIEGANLIIASVLVLAIGQFLNKKIGFLNIVQTIDKIFKDKDFKKYARKKPVSIKDIQITDNWARLKTFAMCVR